jgi:anti-sigma28 factor (negative regulator of flagellin synthesis)
MRINDIGADYLKADQLKGRTATEGTTREAAQPAGAPKTGDSIRISDEARALARGGSDGLDANRIDQIRARILEGAYDSLDSVDKLARRLLASGDL